MQLFDQRKEQKRDEIAKVEKTIRDQQLLKKFDDDYFGKRESYHHNASQGIFFCTGGMVEQMHEIPTTIKLGLIHPSVIESRMKAHLKAYGVTQEIKAMHSICGKNSIFLCQSTGKVSDQRGKPLYRILTIGGIYGQVNLVVPLADVMGRALSVALDIYPEKPSRSSPNVLAAYLALFTTVSPPRGV